MKELGTGRSRGFGFVSVLDQGVMVGCGPVTSDYQDDINMFSRESL